jgi:uncharacterized protein YcgL (UPF0745 family)
MPFSTEWSFKKMERLKKAILFVLISLMCGAAISGCVIPRSNDSEVDKILTYMKKTYPEDEFTYVKTLYGDRLDEWHTEIIMTSKLFPDFEIEGFYSVGDGGKIYYKDNYLPIKFREQTFEKVDEVLREMWGDTAFHIFPVEDYPQIPLAYEDVTSFDEYIASEDNGVKYIIVADIPYEDVNEPEIEQRITEVFAKNNIAGTFYIDFYSDKAIAELGGSDVKYLEYEKEFGIEPHSYKRINCDIYNSDRKNMFYWYDMPLKEAITNVAVGGDE